MKQRVFFALWPEADTRAQIAYINSQLKNTQGRKVNESNLHITLSFIGEIDEARLFSYAEAATTIKTPAFDLILDQLDYFKRSQILWLGSRSVPCELSDLVDKLNQALSEKGFRPEKRLYTPHVTLARKAKPLLAPIEFAPIVWRINSFSLIKSLMLGQSVEYQVLREYRFE